MKPNPFSPSFAILPSSFYGRKQYLETYAKALETPGSAYRCFFLTGTRGSGKTSLLYQYGLQASRRRWDVLKATNIDALDLLLEYVGLTEESTKALTLEPAVSVAGSVDVTIGSLKKSSANRQSMSMLSSRLIKKLKSLRVRNGLAIIVDEAQKLKREDTVRISNAVQDAKLEGLPISLVLCGLPSAYRKLRSYKDCTFIRRMKREKLWTMTQAETMGCLRKMFAKVPEISLTDEQMQGIGQFTGGHPYLIQLVGDNLYTLTESELSPLPGTAVSIPGSLIDEAQAQALVEYKENVLDDVLSGVHAGTRTYIETAFSLHDENGYVDTAEINGVFHRDANQMSAQRANAVNTQVLKMAARGKLKFALPHYNLIFEDIPRETPETTDEEWDFRIIA